MTEELALKPRPSDGIRGAFSCQDYPTCVLLPPHSSARPAQSSIKYLAASIATRLDVRVAVVNRHIKEATIEEWGKVRRTDSTAGDTIRAARMGTERDDSRDYTFCRYEMLVDKNARFKNRRPDLELQTHFGQLNSIYTIHFPSASTELGIDRPRTFIMVAIQTCKMEKDDPALQGLDIHYYEKIGGLHIIDITCIQCLVGRLNDSPIRWAIIDRSGTLARAGYNVDGRGAG